MRLHLPSTKRALRFLLAIALATLGPALPAVTAQAATVPTLSLSNSSPMIYHDDIANHLFATLTGPGGAPIAGAHVKISIPAARYNCTKTTDSSGMIDCAFGPPQPLKPGTGYVIRASFAGGTIGGVAWAATSTQAAFDVIPGDAYASYIGPMTYSAGTTVTFKFKLQEGESGSLGKAIRGARLAVTITGNNSGQAQNCTTGPTSRSGIASCTIFVTLDYPDTVTVGVQWDGGNLYDPVDQGYFTNLIGP